MNAKEIIGVAVAILMVAIGLDLGRRLYDTVKTKQAAA